MMSALKSCIVSALFAAAASIPLTAHAAVSSIPTFVYKGSGCTGVAALPQFVSALGRPVAGAADFLDYTSTWANLESETNWALGCWQGKVSNLSLAVPMTVNSAGANGVKATAAGANDAYYTQIAKSLVSHGFGSAYLRIGWEFNGGWYLWSAKGSPTTWILAYQKIVTAMRAVPGANFKFVWNPAQGMQQIYPYQVYPGDSYVDVIAQDTYNETWDAGYTNPAVMWNAVDNDSWGLAAIITFAKQHSKPVAFPEWGTGTRPDGHGGGDDPAFVDNMATALSGVTVAYQSYWDYNAGDYNSKFSDGENVKAAAAFINDFGSASAGLTSTVPTIKNLGRILKEYSAAYTAVPFKVTCTGCSAQVLQNGPLHYEVIVWNATATTSATLSWSKKASNSNVYDPSVGQAPVKATGAVNSIKLSLSAGGKPLIVAVAL